MKKFAQIFFHLFLLTGAVFADETCVFDATKVDKQFLKDVEIESSHWNPKSLEARIIYKDGSLGYVKKWACKHFGVDARRIYLYANPDLSDRELWLKRVEAIVKPILETRDYDIFVESRKKKTLVIEDLESGFTFDIPHPRYSEFHFEVQEYNDMTIVSMRYYFD